MGWIQTVSRAAFQHIQYYNSKKLHLEQTNKNPFLFQKTVLYMENIKLIINDHAAKV